MRLLRGLFALVLLVTLALPATAREEITSFIADVSLQTDGSVNVTETLYVKAEGVEIRRGIYRDVFTTMQAPDGSKIRAGFEVTSVTRDGNPEPFTVEGMGNFQRIWIGNPDEFISRASHRYVISYSMTGMARRFDDHDELYWNATGNYWIFPILKSQARVTLPGGAVIQDVVGYTGPVGSTEQAVSITRTTDNNVTIRTDRPLGAGEGMSFAVSFQKGILTLPTGMAAFWQWLSDRRDIYLPIFGVILVLLYNLTAWNRVGRDPAKGTIIPLFHPPKDFSPALTHYVYRWGFRDWVAFTATLFDLGVKGLVRIDNPEEGLSVTVTGQDPVGKLPAGEQNLFAYLQSRGTVTVDKAHGVELSKQRDAFHAAIEGENRSVWFNNNFFYAALSILLAIGVLVAMVWFDALAPEWLAVGVIVGALLGIFGTAASAMWKGGGFRRFFVILFAVIIGLNFIGGGIELFSGLTVNTAAVAAGSIVMLTIVFAVLMRAPTIQGRKIMDQIEGFKLYLDTAEKNRLNIIDAPPMTVERFERILPYAIALGVEKPWSEHFEGELARHAVSDVTDNYYRPRWYAGSSDFSTSRISNAVSAAAAGMSAAMVAAQPVQASSSGFSSSGGGGGGSSGGGGGGGGGGGW